MRFSWGIKFIVVCLLTAQFACNVSDRDAIYISTTRTPISEINGPNDSLGGVPSKEIKLNSNLAASTGSVEDSTISSFTPSISSTGLIVSQNDDLVIAINSDSNTVSVVDITQNGDVHEIDVGIEPKSLTIHPNGRFLFVANFKGESISVVSMATFGEIERWETNSMPYGVVASEDRLFVSEFTTSTIAELDSSTGEILDRAEVDSFPSGIALHRPTNTLVVTHMFSGIVTVIDTESMGIIGTIKTGDDSGFTQSVAIDHTGSLAYIPHSRLNTENRFRLFDTTVFPIVNIVDLMTLELLPRQRITLDTADQPVNMPLSAVLSADSETIYIANAGTNDVSVIDTSTNRGVGNIPVGFNPRHLDISQDGSFLYVNNVLEGNMSVIDTTQQLVIDEISLTDIPLSNAILKGKRIFNSASETALTTDGWISCANCHFDGMMDSKTWLGFPDGPRNTPALFDSRNTIPLHWSGNFDELQDVEQTIREIQFGKGFLSGPISKSLENPKAGLSPELDALAAYIGSLESPKAPVTDESRLDEGQKVFNGYKCQSCHVPPYYTDGKLHDVGTGDIRLERNSDSLGIKFNTPSLLNLWLTAPYFHNGSSATLEDVFRTGSVHNINSELKGSELADLILYLKSLPIE